MNRPIPPTAAPSPRLAAARMLPMSLYAVFAAVLTACGGGNGAAGSSSTMSLASGLDTDSASAANFTPSSDSIVVTTAMLDASALLAAQQLAASAMVIESTDASALGTSSSNMVWVKLADERSEFSVGSDRTVRYGAAGGKKWITRTLSGTAPCSNAFFGQDPAAGVVKVCELLSPRNSSETVVSSAPALVTAPSPVQARAPDPVSTPVEIPVTAATPAPATAPAPAPATTSASLMPYIDSSKIPAAGASYSSDRVMAANVADPGQNPRPDTIGAFREPCNFSHMAYDDPIVYPGRPGVSHLHTFFGNTATNANSTIASIAGSGGSTCAGGTLNRTAYWVPSMIDTADGRPIAPSSSLIYYKTGYLGVRPADVKPLPNGLRLIAGNSASTAPQALAGFACVGGGDENRYESIPPCAVGNEVVQSIAFPQCWDGVNLDSPDHKSHMAYAWGGCPSTHPVALPEIAFQIHYKVTADSPSTRWRLSSDNYDNSKPGGYSSHADWFMGWNESILQTITRSCLNASVDCHAYLIGDGRMLY